jgi:hypothetical protein
VVALFLEALRPDAIALGLAMVEEIERQQTDLDRQWTVHLERARYEARLAERRYKAVDPEHRTVARTLERDWNAKLSELEQLEREHSEVQAREKLVLTRTDRARITELSRDVPQLWSAATTTMAQRKAMLRTLVREVCLMPVEGPEGTRPTQVRVLWQAGTVSEASVHQVGGWHVSPAASEKIRALVATATPAPQIAAALNKAHLRTPKGRLWTRNAVHGYCIYHGVRWPHRMPTSAPQPERRRDGAYSLLGVARRLHVSEDTVRRWMNRGWLRSVEGGGYGHPRWFRLDAGTLARLKSMRLPHHRPRRARTRTSRRTRRRRPGTVCCFDRI